MKIFSKPTKPIYQPEELSISISKEEFRNIIIKNTSIMTLYGLRNTKTLSYPVMKLAYCNDKKKAYIGGCDCNIIPENYYKSRVKEVRKLITNK